ncbi:MAG: dihydrolipoyl dehydrogenase [Thermodesulfobacteriota bacterium]|nr:dihydrolipoyl dehydrogenase [Thermodesulfobacteriota bacterium]
MTDQRVVVIGAGPGGYVAAIRAAALGARVTLIENNNVGGTCLNHGCIPSKIMKTSADLFQKFQEADQYGIKLTGKVDPDMAALMERKKRIVDSQKQGILSLLKKNRVELEQGRGFIKEKNLAAVINSQGDEKEIAFDKLILATGTKPLNIPSFPFDGKNILSSNDLLNLQKIPESILIVGGGVIGCEFAFILSALGARVTIVEAMSRLLPLDSIDASCSKILQREMKKKKIKFITDRVVKKAEIKQSMISVSIEASQFLDKKKAETISTTVMEVEKMAVCIGRSPLSENLGLENTGLAADERGWIEVNNKMETRVQNIYAIGDIIGPAKVMLAHAASHEGMVAAENALGGNRTMRYDAVPGAIFTMPEIGNVGITETEAEKRGIEVTCSTVNFRAIGKAQAMGEIAGEAKIIADKNNGKVLGVHIIGPHATDLIAEGTLAVNKGLTLSDLAETIHAHPTLAEIMSEASLKGTGRALHG